MVTRIAILRHLVPPIATEAYSTTVTLIGWRLCDIPASRDCSKDTHGGSSPTICGPRLCWTRSCTTEPGYFKVSKASPALIAFPVN